MAKAPKPKRNQASRAAVIQQAVVPAKHLSGQHIRSVMESEEEEDEEEEDNRPLYIGMMSSLAAVRHRRRAARAGGVRWAPDVKTRVANSSPEPKPWGSQFPGLFLEGLGVGERGQGGNATLGQYGRNPAFIEKLYAKGQANERRGRARGPRSRRAHLFRNKSRLVSTLSGHFAFRVRGVGARLFSVRLQAAPPQDALTTQQLPSNGSPLSSCPLTLYLVYRLSAAPQDALTTLQLPSKWLTHNLNTESALRIPKPKKRPTMSYDQTADHQPPSAAPEESPPANHQYLSQQMPLERQFQLQQLRQAAQTVRGRKVNKSMQLLGGRVGKAAPLVPALIDLYQTVLTLLSAT
eukprot:gene9614-7529_t